MIDLSAYLRRQMPRWERTRDEAFLERAKARLAEAEGRSSGAQSVDAVLAEVGDDPDRAAAALEAENAKTKPRKTLVAGLRSVIDAASQTEEQEEEI